MNNENYIVIQGWMINELNLKRNELIVYAIIYGFSQNEQKFSGSLQYLADWTNSTKQGVIKNLQSLINKGLIEKKEVVINNVKFCEYYTTKFNGGIKQSLTGYATKFNGGIKQSLHNNIRNNLIDNIDNIDSQNTIIELPLKDNSLYPITENMIDEWKELYRNIDIMQELRKMKGWLNANPTKRKTNILRFINSWLSRAMDNTPKPTEPKFNITKFDI